MADGTSQLVEHSSLHQNKNYVEQAVSHYRSRVVQESGCWFRVATELLTNIVSRTSSLFLSNESKYQISALLLEGLCMGSALIGSFVSHAWSMVLLWPANSTNSRQLLAASEAHRLHLQAWLDISQPGILVRLLLVACQVLLVCVHLVLYPVAPKLCHRFLAFVSNLTAFTYERAIADLGAGQLPAWEAHVPSRAIKDMWHLPAAATVQDALLAMHADALHYRSLNQRLAMAPRSAIQVVTHVLASRCLLLSQTDPSIPIFPRLLNWSQHMFANGRITKMWACLRGQPCTWTLGRLYLPCMSKTMATQENINSKALPGSPAYHWLSDSESTWDQHSEAGSEMSASHPPSSLPDGHQTSASASVNTSPVKNASQATSAGTPEITSPDRPIPHSAVAAPKQPARSQRVGSSSSKGIVPRAAGHSKSRPGAGLLPGQFVSHARPVPQKPRRAPPAGDVMETMEHLWAH